MLESCRRLLTFNILSLLLLSIRLIADFIVHFFTTTLKRSAKSYNQFGLVFSKNNHFSAQKMMRTVPLKCDLFSPLLFPSLEHNLPTETNDFLIENRTRNIRVISDCSRTVDFNFQINNRKLSLSYMPNSMSTKVWYIQNIIQNKRFIFQYNKSYIRFFFFLVYLEWNPEIILIQLILQARRQDLISEEQQPYQIHDTNSNQCEDSLLKFIKKLNLEQKIWFLGKSVHFITKRLYSFIKCCLLIIMKLIRSFFLIIIFSNNFGEVGGAEILRNPMLSMTMPMIKSY